MALGVRPPIEPMLAQRVRELPADGYLYEPKWDGFRCLSFRDGAAIDMRSRNDRPLARYFPEVVEGLLAVGAQQLVIDGELVIETEAGFDFEALLARLHPAASRVERLRGETPASLVAFDLLALGGEDLRERPFAERREALETALADAAPPLHLTPITDDARAAERWIEDFHGSGIDGIVAKPRDLRYHPGKRVMTKVKSDRTADCVVAGFRFYVDRPLPSSLLLGLYDDHEQLRHVGVASQFSRERRAQLLEEIAPAATSIRGHPWERGFLTGGNPIGRLPGAAASWNPDEMQLDWVPLRPELVCEVAYDQVDGMRLRHPARFMRWRPDRDPESCRLDQLAGPALSLHEVMRAG
jgi:ATP-dependent DNA ligase